MKDKIKNKKNFRNRIKRENYFFFLIFSSVDASVAVAVSSALGLSSISVVISSIGFGGGVVAIVQPIHAPMNIMATNAMKTGIVTTQSLKVF